MIGFLRASWAGRTTSHLWISLSVSAKGEIFLRGQEEKERHEFMDNCHSGENCSPRDNPRLYGAHTNFITDLPSVYAPPPIRARQGGRYSPRFCGRPHTKYPHPQVLWLYYLPTTLPTPSDLALKAKRGGEEAGDDVRWKLVAGKKFHFSRRPSTE